MKLNKSEARADFIRYELTPDTPSDAIPQLWSEYTARLVKASELPISALTWPAPTLTRNDRPGDKPRRKASKPQASKPQASKPQASKAKQTRKRLQLPNTAVVVAGPPADAWPVMDGYQRVAKPTPARARQLRAELAAMLATVNNS
jgi:hypothetical protein